MQFQVPQFIETEDKIVGPLTIRQFLFIGGSAATSFLLFFMLKPAIWAIITVFLVGSSFALAFVKINGRPLVKVIFSAMHFYWQPQRYVWQPENPKLAKDESALKSLAQGKLSLENIVSGTGLKNVWQNLQTGKKAMSPAGLIESLKAEKYEIFSRKTGERQAGRRIDYR
ncbi:MAG: PrgI family protein [Candidatus Liptonbacteria bacterium]|nr:PrgI family protein [Candidatus Liptonbacteria bacterium]